MIFNRLKNLTDQIQAVYGIPNFDVTVYHEHQEIFRTRHGYKDLEKTVPVSEDDLYLLYSGSKLTLVTCVMQLVEKGILNLDDPISKYLPEILPLTVKQGEEILPCQTEPTIENYLAMQGGINYDLSRPDFKEYWKENPNATTIEAARQFLSVPMDYVPGTRFQYSMCHDILAAVIEVATGQHYKDYVKEHIADPLGMKELYFHQTAEIQARMVQQYLYNHNTQNIVSRERIVPISHRNGYDLGSNYDSAGAGIITKASDYILLADALANDGIGATGNRILTRESIDNIRTSRMETALKKQDYIKNMDYGYEYGLGVRTLVYDSTSKSPVGEFGWDGYGGVFVLSDVDNHLSMVYCMSVCDMFQAKQIHHKLRDAMYEDFLEVQ